MIGSPVWWLERYALMLDRLAFTANRQRERGVNSRPSAHYYLPKVPVRKVAPVPAGRSIVNPLNVKPGDVARLNSHANEAEVIVPQHQLQPKAGSQGAENSFKRVAR